MKVIARKTKYMTVLTLELILGAVMMAVSVIGVPIGMAYTDINLLLNPYGLGLTLAIMIGFTLVGYFSFVRPYQIYCKMPEVQAETDGTYLYLHGKKEAKIPLCDMEGAYIDSHLPNIMSSDFLVHLLSEQYGHIIIEVPNYGKYKLYFISRAQDAASVIIALADSRLNG